MKKEILRKIKYKVKFYDPFSEFSLCEREAEVRFDPLSGDSSRVLNIDFSPPEMDVLSEVSGTEKNCPFCPERVEVSTPKFTEDIAPEGRLQLGGLYCFPNIVSYSSYSSVVTVTPYHFKMHHEIEKENLVSAFKLALTYLERVKSVDSRVKFSSINWNFLYPAGSSIAHPHLQTMADPFPSCKMKKVLDRAFSFYVEKGRSIFDEYVESEISIGERFILEKDDIFLLISFSPLGAIPDYTFVWRGCDSVDKVKERLESFVFMLLKLFRYFSTANIYSFNLALYLSFESLPFYTTFSRVTPRIFPRPVRNSDVNFVKLMQDEGWVLVSPESVREKVLSSLTGVG